MMGTWLIVISTLTYCIYPSQTYLVEEVPESDVSSSSSEFATDNLNYSTITHAEKMAISEKPFRPSKQLFDHIVYGKGDDLNIKRVDHISTPCDNSDTECKSLDTAYKNLLILPPETLTYNWDQAYNSDGRDVVSDQEKIKGDIITYGPPIEDSYVENSNTEITVQENPNKSKTREVHYHKHKHLHEYDQKQEHNPKSIHDYLQSRRHVQRHAIPSDYNAEKQNLQTKTGGSQNQQYHGYPNNAEFGENKDNKNTPHHSNGKRHNRNQTPREIPPQSSHPRYGKHSVAHPQKIRHHPGSPGDRKPYNKQHSEHHRVSNSKQPQLHHREKLNLQPSSEQINSHEDDFEARQKKRDNKHFKHGDDSHFRKY